MPDRWMDERDRQWRNWRSEAYGRGRDDYRGGPREDRSWGETRGNDERGARFEGRDRDRVFGERDTGAEYNRGGQPRPGGGAYGAGGSYGGGESYGRDHDWRSDYRRGREDHRGGREGGGYGGGRPDWQDRDYQGVSPAMRQGEYEIERGGWGAGARGQPRFQSQDYTRGGRFYGDDARQPIYREEYGQGGQEYGRVPRGWDEGEDFRTAERYRQELRRPVSGGTGGYDYDERGYGDAGRGREHEADRGGYGFQGHARGAGDFLARAGEKLSSWFGNAMGEARRDLGPEGAGPRRYSSDFGREARWEDPGHRGRGPKGYQRSDDRINDEVCHRLTDDPWLDASNINVAVSGGEVTLSGSVDNREAKHRAERLVEDIPGVSHVQNNLRIGGDMLTGSGRGFGDSALEAQMKRGDGDGTTGGADTASTRSTTRRS